MAAKENARGQGGRENAFETEAEHITAHNDNVAAIHPDRTPLLNSAMAYRQCRLDLIPLRAHDKVPADRRWQTREYDQAQTMERARRGSLNLGVRLPADVVVVDVDPRNFPDGRDTLTELAKATDLDLSAAPHVITGNRDHPGHHYYFRKPASAVLLDTVEGFEGVEFKSFGRQVVAAGSVHPTGGRYEWAPDSPPLHTMPDLPSKLLELARRPERSNAPSGAGEITPEQLAKSLEHLDATDYRDQSVWLELMMSCHHATNGEGRQEFIDWSTSDPEYAHHDWLVGRRWDSLHSDRDGAVTIATLRKHLHDRGADIAPPEPEDDFDVWETDTEPAKEHLRWRFLSIAELETLPPPKWLIPDMLTEGSLAAIYGPPESGKSFLAVDISMAVAGGLLWHGRRVERGAVLYIAAEGAPGLGKRVRAWKVQHGAEEKSFDFHLMRDDLNLAAEKDASVRTFVQQVLEELGSLKLIVIDTLNQTAAGADENSAKDMSRYIASMKKLRDETGATVVVVHHSGKDASKGMRGSTALLGAMDTTIEVARSNGGRSLVACVRKQKDSERAAPMHFTLEKISDSLVLRATVSSDAAADFEACTDPVLEMARRMATERGGKIALKELVEIICRKNAISDKTARRKIEQAIPRERSNARAAGDGGLVWQEPTNASNPKLGIDVRTEG